MVSFEHQDFIFPFQIHVVHYNTKYDSFTEAMVHPDGLAVLAAFLEVSSMDPAGEGCNWGGQSWTQFWGLAELQMSFGRRGEEGQISPDKNEGVTGIGCVSQGTIPPCWHCHHRLVSLSPLALPLPWGLCVAGWAWGEPILP